VGSLEKLQYGIQINLEKLDKIEVHADKGYATMGGSVFTWQVIQKLYAAGKQSSKSI
jgi:FAD/FMN-containing dehydrogenase